MPDGIVGKYYRPLLDSTHYFSSSVCRTVWCENEVRSANCARTVNASKSGTVFIALIKIVCCYFSGAQKGKLLKFHVTGSNQNFIGNIQTAKTEEPEELHSQSDKQNGRKS